MKKIFAVARRTSNADYSFDPCFDPEIQGRNTSGSWGYILADISEMAGVPTILKIVDRGNYYQVGAEIKWGRKNEKN